MRCGDAHQVPAGGALAVDREGFSAAVTERIGSHPLITVERGELTGLPPAGWDQAIIATGPLTSPSLAEAIRAETGEDALAFFDAIAPIVHADTIDMSVCWHQSRYDKVGPGGTGKDYINCPMTEAEYNAFVDALISGDKTEFKQWENVPYFDGCLPIEVMAERGRETLRHGPMKPMGLTNAHKPGEKPYAVVQLRQDNALGTLYNMVGFQTKLKYGAQKDIFRMIPGLGNAEFARLGGLHRNTYINSPALLDSVAGAEVAAGLRFAGQITGCEGYVESAAIGLLAGRFAAAERLGKEIALPPPTTAFGALLGHITGGHLAVRRGAGAPFVPADEHQFRALPAARARRRPASRRASSASAARTRRWPRSAPSAPGRLPTAQPGSAVRRFRRRPSKGAQGRRLPRSRGWGGAGRTSPAPRGVSPRGRPVGAPACRGQRLAPASPIPSPRPRRVPRRRRRASANAEAG